MDDRKSNRYAVVFLSAVFFIVLGLGQAAAQDAAAEKPLQIVVPNEFPRFSVPGHETAMDSLRSLYYLHFSKPVQHAAIWDPWLSKSMLWPAAGAEFSKDEVRAFYKRVFLDRHISDEGYVSTEQHLGLAHIHGWPFPTWQQADGIGWHFCLKGMPYASMFRMTETDDVSQWQLTGAKTVEISSQTGWTIEWTAPAAVIQTPAFSVAADTAPFIRLEWKHSPLPTTANPYIEWTTHDHPTFNAERRMYFSPLLEPTKIEFTMIPVYRSPLWKGKITGIRFCFDNAATGTVTIRSLITASDSRHNINNAVFLQGSEDYFRWTDDIDFLRRNITRMRKALAYGLSEFSIEKNYYVTTPWVGHDGSSGLVRRSDGDRTMRTGYGIGNNYWDLLPFGGKDALATIYYYDAILRMARLERYIAAHPELNIAHSIGHFSPERLEQLAESIKKTAGSLFWNEKSGRFVAAIDAQGTAYDYGFTFVNLEAIYYGFATSTQTRQILDWIDGKRIVDGDTSQGADIYHWRFGPRATTKRNIEYYNFVWNRPEILKFGDQVQDGGAVLGFSYFDVMSRLSVNGPDDAWRRLKAILGWFEEVQAEGGYRAYYAKPGRGTLQGGGPPGGLGMDAEFYESVLLPQVMLYGFMGFQPYVDGFAVRPLLPSAWPSLSIDGIALADGVLRITANADRITIECDVVPSRPMRVRPPAGNWQVRYLDASGAEITSSSLSGDVSAGVPLHKNQSRTLVFISQCKSALK